MRIIRNNSIIEHQSENIKKLELSNITLLSQQTPIFGTYYSIDPNTTEVVEGFRAVEEFIGIDSRVVYNRIEGIPVYFQGDFNSTINFEDDGGGVSLDFSIEGMVLPNSIKPKANDFFVPDNTAKPTLLRVTDYKYNDFKETPFINTTFDIASREQSKIDDLNKQIGEDAVFLISSIGTDRINVISKTKYVDLISYTEDYLAIVELYRDLFFNKQFSTFAFKEGGITMEDRIFNTFLFENRIITMDPVITFARSNMDTNITHLFISFDPLEMSTKYSPFEFIVSQKSSRFTKKLDQIKLFPDSFDRRYNESVSNGVMTSQGRVIICEYMSEKLDTYSDEWGPLSLSYITKVFNNDPTGLAENSMELAILKLYNEQSVDFGIIDIEDAPSKRNYYLIPILLYYYRKYIETFR